MQDMMILEISLTLKNQLKILSKETLKCKDEVVYYKGHRLHGVVVDKLHRDAS